MQKAIFQGAGLSKKIRSLLVLVRPVEDFCQVEQRGALGAGMSDLTSHVHGAGEIGGAALYVAAGGPNEGAITEASAQMQIISGGVRVFDDFTEQQGGAPGRTDLN